MDIKSIDFGKVLLTILELILIKPLTLPLRIYFNSLVTLSGTGTPDSEESILSSDFPLYIWYIRIFDALIALIYPIGFVMAILAGTNSYTGGFSSFLGVLLLTYFLPLGFGLVRELAQITLKMLLYLKLLSKRQ